MQQAVQLLNTLIQSFELTTNDNKTDDKKDNTVVADKKYMKQVWGKYASIPNSYSKKTIDYIIECGHTSDDIVWCASEKVHGANFSLITNGVDIMAGSRTQILGDGTKFYGGWRDVMKNEKENVLNAFKLLKKKYKDKIKVVIIYGELFGGSYSPQNIKTKKYKCIQTGVYYSPKLHFYAFDIKTDLQRNTPNDNSDDNKNIDGRLSVSEAVEILKESKFLYAKILKKGTFNELLKFDVDNLESTIPSLLNLAPPTNPDNNQKIKNIAEGIVIRKLNSINHQLLKIKAKKFLEIEEAARQKGQKRKQKKKTNKNKPDSGKKLEMMKNKVLKFADNDFIDYINRCINEQRLQSVESKIGKMDIDNIKRIQGEMMKDIFKELQDTKSDIMNGLQKGQKGVVRAYVAVSVQIFFKPKLEALEKQNNDT